MYYNEENPSCDLIGTFYAVKNLILSVEVHTTGYSSYCMLSHDTHGMQRAVIILLSNDIGYTKGWACKMHAP